MNEVLTQDERKHDLEPALKRETRATPLEAGEELQLQQLQQSHYWWGRHNRESNGVSKNGSSLPGHTDLPEFWELTRGFTLHSWQKDCVESWFKNGKRGVIKVVTGAGKTVLALAIAEQLQQTVEPQLRVAVVVPTVVLLDQWREELASHSNLPARAIALMGGGNSNQFTDETRVMICVLNSASKKLAQEVERTGIGDRLLLIVDECHRAGAAEMRHIFTARRAFSLGLSATPERTEDPADGIDSEGERADDETTASFDDSVLGQELGPVVFELNYADAIARGVLPPFRIVHYGLTLAPKEREKYERLSREIKELRDELETGNRRGLALIRWCRSHAGSHNPKAVQLLALTSERKRLLYRIEERSAAVVSLLQRAFDQNPSTKAILFHESIDEVMSLFDLLRHRGFSVVAEHSEFPDAMRAESLRLFRQGTARVIVSARSLIEGFNVPSADMGIVVAASSSVRQRVQTLGRLLRRTRTMEGAEKQASLCVLYAAGTVDELIYEKADWESFVGADRNEYLLWQNVRETVPVLRSGPPRRPPLDEDAIDLNVLQPGGVYTGNPDAGSLFSLDTQGTIRDESGRLAKPNGQLRSMLTPLKRTGGRFRITPKRHLVIRLEKTKEGWQSTYLGRLDAPLELVEEMEHESNSTKHYQPGDPFPLEKAHGLVFSVLQRDKRLIASKKRGEIRFVIPAEKLTDPNKRAALRQIQERLAKVYAQGHRINKIIVTKEGNIVYVFDNSAYYVGRAPEGETGFIIED